MPKGDMLKLVSVTGEEDIIKVLFASYLKSDFVECSMTLIIAPDRRIREIYFSSNDFGTAEWKNGQGITDCNRWEDEDSAQSTSSLNKHYTAILQNGSMKTEYAESHIIPDVLSKIENRSLRTLVTAIVKNKEYQSVLNFAELELV
jgi:hypothetical protein